MTQKTFTTVRFGNCELSFTDEDVVDLENIGFREDYNHDEKLWLLHDHGFTLCVVLASNLQDALDAAVDANKLDRFLIDFEDTGDRQSYLTKDCKDRNKAMDDLPAYIDGDDKYYWEFEPSFLGNAGEPFDIDSLGYVCFDLPKRSLTRALGEVIDGTDGHFI